MIKPSLGAGVLVAIVLAASACGSSHATSDSLVRVSAKRIIQSRLIENGTVRCTASVLTAPAQAGEPLGNRRVTFIFHNVSHRSVQLGQDGTALVRSPDGTTYDSAWPGRHSTGIYVPPTLAPGGTKRTRVYLPRVSWEGPLRVTPSCGGAQLHPVRVVVTSPGLPASPRAAVTEVVAAAGHLLDHCRPHASGVSVLGEVVPRRGPLRPRNVRCSVTLHPEHGFYVAQLRVVTPTDLHGVRILPTYYEVREPQDQIAHRTTEVIAWEFVVTRRGATPIVYFVGTTAKWHQIWADPGEITAHTWCGGSSGELSPHGRPDFLFLSSDCYAGKG